MTQRLLVTFESKIRKSLNRPGHLRVTSGALAKKHCRERESVMLRSCFGPRFKTGTETRPKHDRFASPAVIFRK